MATASLSTTIACKAEDIFDLVADIRRNSEWAPGFGRAEKTSSGPVGLGATFRTNAKGIGELEIRIARHESPTRLDFVGTSRSATMHHEFVLHPDGQSTQVQQRIEVQPKGVLRVMAPLMAVAVKRMIRGNTAHLKHYLERPGTG